MAKAKPALTIKQAAFVSEYLENGGNAAAAYRAAYSVNGNSAHISGPAHKVRNHPAVKEAIAAGRLIPSQAVAKALEKYAVTQDRLAEEMARLAFSDLRQVVEWGSELVPGKPGEKPRRVQFMRLKDASEIDDDAHKAICEVARLPNGELRVKLYDKRQSIMDLARLKGLITEKVEQTGTPSQVVAFKIER